MTTDTGGRLQKKTVAYVAPLFEKANFSSGEKVVVGDTEYLVLFFPRASLLKGVEGLAEVAVFVAEGDEHIFADIRETGLNAGLFNYFISTDIYRSVEQRHLREIGHGHRHAKPVYPDEFAEMFAASVRHFKQTGHVYPPD